MSSAAPINAFAPPAVSNLCGGATDRRPLYIPGLDGLRALSFALVFIAHAATGVGIPAGLGVNVFFFLSGYLITTLLRREWEGHGRVSIRQFYIRRVLRIAPPMYVTYLAVLLITYVGILPAPSAGITWGAVSAQSLHATNYYSVYAGEAHLPLGTSVLWSLAVEEHFYVFFPILFVAAARRSRRALGWILLSLCASIFAWRCALAFVWGVEPLRLFAGTDTRMDAIIYGCLLAVWWNPLYPGEALGPRIQVSLGIALAAAIAFVYRLGSTQMAQTLGFTLQSCALVPVFSYVLAYPGSPVVTCLEVWPMRMLGKLSYTLYLVHFSLLLCFRGRLESELLVFLGALLCSIAFAALTFLRSKDQLRGCGSEFLAVIKCDERQPSFRATCHFSAQYFSLLLGAWRKLNLVTNGSAPQSILSA